MRRNIAQEARQIHMAPLMHLLDPLVKKVRIASASVGREVRNSKGDFAQIARAPRDSQLKMCRKLSCSALRRVLWSICRKRTIEPLHFNSGLPEHAEASISAPLRVPAEMPASLCTEIVTCISAAAISLDQAAEPGMARANTNESHLRSVLSITALTSMVAPRIGQPCRYLNAGGIASCLFPGDEISVHASNR